MTALDDLNNMDQPAFASNCNGRIVDWNEGAERLLGHAASDMIGRHCFEVLDGRDIFGNRFCHERCAIRCMIRRHEPINHYQLNYRTASSDRIDVSVSAVVVNGKTPQDSLVVHLLESAGSKGAEFGSNIPDKPGNRLPLDDTADPDARPPELTARELKILRLLAAGSTTSEMVSHLCISGNTVAPIAVWRLSAWPSAGACFSSSASYPDSFCSLFSYRPASRDAPNPVTSR